MGREYPPSVVVHRPDCFVIIGDGLLPMATAQIALNHPNGRQHGCYQFHQHSIGVVQVVKYPAHRYKPGHVTYPDADKPMCSICGGTHGVLEALFLPPGVR